jgi:hypothetical protein
MCDSCGCNEASEKTEVKMEAKETKKRSKPKPQN